MGMSPPAYGVVGSVDADTVAQAGGREKHAAFFHTQWLLAIPAPQADESSLLEGLLETQDNSRLTCQIEITPALDGLIVRLPKSQF